jgi:threonine aldolase
MKPAVERQHFASDNNSGICPEALQALLEADASGHEPGYGDDRWTKAACDSVRELFQTDCEVFFVFNGTAANSLALASLCQSYHAVICHEVAHIEADECGGPEFFSNGSKLLTVAGPDGKVTPDAVEHMAKKRTDLHFPKAKALSLTQSTECGTLYTVEELRALAAMAKRHGLKVHMDGARFANAVAALDVHPSEITWRAGVDVLCFGGTKNGLPLGEAVVFFKRELAEDFAWRVKQAGQLASKMRYISAPWTGMLQNDVWLKHARHANAMAKRLQEQLLYADIPLMFPAQANAVFAQLPVTVQTALRDRGWRFYTFIGEGGCRLMCSWDTTAETVDWFVRDIVEASKPQKTNR